MTELTPDPTPGCTELFTGNDPFTGANLTGALSCTSGNPELDPEESDIWNIGFTFRPVGDLEISLDYQEIEYSDRIVRLGTEDTLRRDLANLLLANGLSQEQYDELDAAEAAALRAEWYAGGSDPNITRDSTGTVLQVVRIPGNVAVMNVNVIDFRLNYGVQLGDFGYLSADLAHTHYTKYDYEDAFGDITDAVGARNGATDIVPPIPEYRTNLRLNWIKDNHSLGIITKYTPAIDFDGSIGPTFGPEAVTVEAPDEIDPYTVVDVRYGYLFEDLWRGSLGLAVGLNNAFDEDAQALPILGGLETRLQNPLGRTYFLEFTYTME